MVLPVTIPARQPSTPIFGTAEDAFAQTKARLKELDRLRRIGMEQAERLAARTSAFQGTTQEELRFLTGAKGTVQEFDRLQRAVRQIVVLEFELRGLFKAPDRDGPKKFKLCGTRLPDLDGLLDFHDYRSDLADLNDLRVRMDYSRDPLHEVIADIRSIVGATAPEDDPFAPPAGPRRPPARQMAMLERASEALRLARLRAGRASMTTRTAAAQKEAAPTIAAKPALPRKGFRVPPTSKHNPKTARGPVKGRGPP
jgi:hypothetical protein